MTTLGSAIGTILGNAISKGYTAEDFTNGAKDFYNSLANVGKENNAGSSGGSHSSNSVGNIEERKQNAQNLLNKYGTTADGLALANTGLTGGEKIKSENGNVYYVANGQEYLIGGNDYNKMQFYNGLAQGGANSAIMKDINNSQRKIDEYVSQLADYRATLQSSAEEAARAAYVNQQLAQKTLRNNLSRYGLENSGYYQKSQQSLKNEYEQALADIKNKLDSGLNEANAQEKNIRREGADAIAEILENNGLLNQDTIGFATKEFPILKVSDVPLEQGLYAGKTAAKNKKDEVSAEEFAAALNGDKMDEFRSLANYVLRSDSASEQMSKIKNLLEAGLDRNILALIMQRLLANRR